MPIAKFRKPQPWISWTDFIEIYCGKIRGRANREAATQACEQFAFCLPLGAMTNELDLEDVDNFKARLYALGNAPATINKKFRYVRQVISRAIEQHQLLGHKAILRSLKPVREPRKIIRALTLLEYHSLLEACPSDFYLTIIRLAAEAGLRRNEILNLRWKDFDRSRYVLTIRDGKNGDEEAALSDTLGYLVLHNLEEDAEMWAKISPRTLNRRFSEIVKMAEIQPCTLHDLRRTFCTNLAKAGVNQFVIQRLARHASAATTAKYYQHIDLKTKQKALARMWNGEGPY